MKNFNGEIFNINRGIHYHEFIRRCFDILHEFSDCLRSFDWVIELGFKLGDLIVHRFTIRAG